jgi:hypothetical protein
VENNKEVGLYVTKLTDKMRETTKLQGQFIIKRKKDKVFIIDVDARKMESNEHERLLLLFIDLSMSIPSRTFLSA